MTCQCKAFVFGLLSIPQPSETSGDWPDIGEFRFVQKWLTENIGGLYTSHLYVRLRKLLPAELSAF